jgi:hypothetical protein
MHPSRSTSRSVLVSLLALLALFVAGCQTTRPADPKPGPQLQPYTDPQERPRNGPGPGWILLRRMSS